MIDWNWNLFMVTPVRGGINSAAPLSPECESLNEKIATENHLKISIISYHSDWMLPLMVSIL